jgi:hypothetical protein
MVESVSTPPAVSSMRRNSFLGTVFVDDSTNATVLAHPNENRNQNPNQNQNPHEQERRPRPRHERVESPESRAARVLSGLQPPSTDATRSSYMTSSTVSRMSGLSDFPAPPKSHHHPHPYNHPGNVENSEENTVVTRPMPQQEEQQNSHLAPPKHMSLLSSYFNEALAESESRAQSRTGDVQQDSPALMIAALEEEDRVPGR